MPKPIRPIARPPTASSGITANCNPTVVDFFAGAGGLSLGLAAAGFDILAAFENWQPAALTYSNNFRHPIFQNDLASLSRAGLRTLLRRDQIDLVVGGPPCQGFSVQRIGTDTDKRNNLVLSFADFVTTLRPRLFVMENVIGLLGHRGAAVLREFLVRLEKVGYRVRTDRVNMAEYGVPQTRRRVILSGWLADELPPFSLPVGALALDDFRTVRSAIGDLKPPPEDGRPSSDDPLHRRMRLSATNLDRLRHIPPGGGFEHLPVDLRVNCHRDGPERIGHRNVYGRLHADQPAGTITARFDSFTRGKFAHPFEDRNITLREGARLQTFPDSHTFVGTQEEIAAQIGNAVPPLFATQLGKAIRAYLASESTSPDGQMSLDTHLSRVVAA